MVSNAPPPRPTDTTTGQPLGESTGTQTGTLELQKSRQRRRVPAKLVTTLVVIGIAVWFIVANRQKAQIRLWVPTVSASMWIVLLVTFVVGALFGYFMRRRRPRSSKRD